MISEKTGIKQEVLDEIVSQRKTGLKKSFCLVPVHVGIIIKQVILILRQPVVFMPDLLLM